MLFWILISKANNPAHYLIPTGNKSSIEWKYSARVMEILPSCRSKLKFVVPKRNHRIKIPRVVINLYLFVPKYCVHGIYFKNIAKE